MNCKQCGSRHLKTLPYVREMGTYSIENGSTPDDDDSPYDTCYTELAKTACPPQRARQVASTVGIIIGIVIMLFALLFGIIALAIGLLILIPSVWCACRNFLYNTGPYPQQYALWEQSFICIDCGHVAGTLD
jgi:hypothetical protein